MVRPLQNDWLMSDPTNKDSRGFFLTAGSEPPQAGSNAAARANVFHDRERMFISPPRACARRCALVRRCAKTTFEFITSSMDLNGSRKRCSDVTSKVRKLMAAAYLQRRDDEGPNTSSPFFWTKLMSP